jgi:hypothetical protein
VSGGGGPDDIEQLVELQCALFREDGAVHDRFVDVRWALNESGCVQVGVDCFFVNEPARRLYERRGFVAQSLRSVRTL